MPMTIDGNGSITGLVAGGLPDATIVQADLATNVAGNGPAFLVYGSANQTNVTPSTNTKIAFNTEAFDTNNNFDSTTNYRFTPTVAGYYQLNLCCYVTGSSITAAEPFIHKNGSAYSSGQYVSATVAASILTASNIIYFNGSSDYAEFYMYATTSAGNYTINHSLIYTYASGALVRAA